MRAQYPAEGINLRTEIVSLADLLAPAAANLACPLTRRSVYYHDPCYHARYNGVVEQPRRALSQLAELRELAWNRTDTECCGAGGLLPKTCRRSPIRCRSAGSPGPHRGGGGHVVRGCAFMASNARPRSRSPISPPRWRSCRAAFAAPTTGADDENLITHHPDIAHERQRSRPWPW
jgi:hypothetical protein